MNYYLEKKDGKFINFFPGKLRDGKYKISELKVIRSPKANRLYWGFILSFIRLEYEKAGYIHIEQFLHELFKKYLLKRERVKSDFSNKYIFQIGSTAKLNTKEFSKYIDRIKAICEFGKLSEIPELESLEPFIIPDLNEEELLRWIDEHGM